MIGKTMEFFKRSVRGFLANKCSMHAAGLTYFSMLAYVPMLCLLLFTAKMCGVDHYAHARINERLDAMIANVEHGQDDDIASLAAPTDEALEKKRIAAEEFSKQAREIANVVFERIDNFDIGTLGWIGFGFLLWTVISSVGMIEVSFNEIFGVPKPRPFFRRAALYFAISIVVPIFAALAMSIPLLGTVKNILTATMGALWLTKWVSDGAIMLLDSWLFRFATTFAMASLNFAFVFWVIPNCRVGFRHAWRGGMATAFLFGMWMKICAVAQVGIAKSSALYGSFAFFPIVLAWMYVSWQIVLFGANMVNVFAQTEKEGIRK